MGILSELLKTSIPASGISINLVSFTGRCGIPDRTRKLYCPKTAQFTVNNNNKNNTIVYVAESLFKALFSSNNFDIQMKFRND